MKNRSALIFVLLATPSLFAANLDGLYCCDDAGMFELKQTAARTYYAALTYADGSASALAEVRFAVGRKEGVLLRDDVDPKMGRMLVTERGSRLVLEFDSGETVTCVKARQ